MAEYKNLPGVEVQIADGGLIVPEVGTTESMLIIGVSSNPDAPKEPVLIQREADLSTLGFGAIVDNQGKVNSLSQAWKVANDGGARRIYLMAIEGETQAEKFAFIQEQLFGILADFPVQNIVLTDVYANDNVDLSAEDLSAYQAEGVTNEYKATGDALSFPVGLEAGVSDTLIINETTVTLGEKAYDNIDSVVQDLNNGLASANISGVVVKNAGNQIILVSEATFTIDPLSTSLTLLGLESKAVEHIVEGDFAKMLGIYAEKQTLALGQTVGYIGTTSAVTNSLTGIRDHVNDLLATENDYTGYLQVVSGPDFGYRLPDRQSMHYRNGVVTYAALVTTLRPESATTQKPVYGVAGLRYQMSTRQLSQLSSKKYVTFRLRNNVITVTDGITTAPDIIVGGKKQPSDFALLSTLRITQAAAQVVREVSEPFIGEPNEQPEYNALSASIRGGLEAMKAAKAIRDYRFSVVTDGANLNNAVVTLEIIPGSELRRVQVNVTLTPSL